MNVWKTLICTAVMMAASAAAPLAASADAPGSRNLHTVADTMDKADTAAKPDDAWTKIENEQMGMAMSVLMDDATSEKLRLAAQARYNLDDEAGERFMVCMLSLGGHPNYTAAKVTEGLNTCKQSNIKKRQ